VTSPMTTISNRVLEALQADPRTKDALIDVSLYQGIVTLTGTVKSNAMREAAVKIARQQPGVISVIDELKVK